MSDNLAFDERKMYKIHRDGMALLIGAAIGFPLSLVASNYVFGASSMLFTAIIVVDELVCLALLANSYRLFRRFGAYSSD
jgi:hypothetical protein